jgi:Uma2 family endonuclease
MTTVGNQPQRPHIKTWTKEEYLELVERGAFRGQRVYLFRGDIIEMAPQGHPHAFAIMKLNRYFTTIFADPFEVRIQLPFVTPGRSVPEPDAVVCTAEHAARRPHPAEAELVVEVSYSSIHEDHALAEEYAAAHVPEYWIVDTDARRLEIFRHPISDPTMALGYRYESTQLLVVGDAVAPLNRPDSLLAVASLFAQ